MVQTSVRACDGMNVSVRLRLCMCLCLRLCLCIVGTSSVLFLSSTATSAYLFDALAGAAELAHVRDFFKLEKQPQPSVTIVHHISGRG